VVFVEIFVWYFFYCLNCDYVVVLYIEVLIWVRDEIVNRIGVEVVGWLLVLFYVGLFGFFVCGSVDLDSDIDVLFVCFEVFVEIEVDVWLD